MDFNPSDLEGAKLGGEKEKARIVESFIPLVISTLKRYYILNQDNLQELIIEILKCIYLYNPKRNVSFPGFLKVKLRHRALEILREKPHLSLNKTNKEGEELQNILADEKSTEDIVLEEETSRLLEVAMNQLEIEEKLLLYYYFDKRLKPKEVADKLGIKERTFRWRKQKILEKLRRDIDVLQDN